MKKNYLFVVVLGAAVLTGCSQDEQLGMMQENRSGFTGALELSDSRTTLGEDNKVNWVEGADEVSIFEKDDQNTQYKVKSVSNGVAQFEFVNYIEKTDPVSLDAYYSVYPYADANSISAESVISVAVPSTIKNYSGKDDAMSQALMVAKSETTDLKYSNAQGILLLRLNAQKPNNYGAIKSIKLTSAKYKLAGTATMSWAEGVEKPEAKIGEDGTNELTIELASALQTALPKSTDGKYAEYYIPVVPTVFEKNEDGTGDVTMTITFEKCEYVKNVGIDFTIGRNKIKPLKHTVGSKDFTGTTEGTENVWDGETLTSITPDNGVYIVTKPSELAWLVSQSPLTGDESVTIELQNNLDMGGFTLMKALIAQREDALTFKGNGNTISNVKIISGDNDNTTGQASMFYAYPNSTLNVSNLTLENVTVTADESASGYAAAVVGYCEGKASLDNVDVVNATVVGVKSSGMLVGHLSGSLNATNCDVDGTVTLADFAEETNGHYAGEYIGTIAGNVELNKCSENVDVTGNLSSANVGIVYGRFFSGSFNLDGAAVVDNADALATAVAAGATNLYLMPGEYDVRNCGGKTLTISGTKETVLKVMNEGEDGCDYGFGAAGTGVGNVTFNGLTINTTSNTGNYKGYAYMKGTFNDCDFVGPYSLNNADDFVFNKCTFDFKDGYFWTWGANNVTFGGCTFNGNSKTILAHGYASTVITIKDCTFAATEKGYTGSGDWTAAVEIDPAGTNVYTINFEGNNTKTENYADWTRIKDGSTGHTITGLN